MYDQKGYKRRKKGIVKRSLCPEGKCAFDKIKQRWDISDREILGLLRNYTVTEIIEGEFDDGFKVMFSVFKFSDLNIAQIAQ